MVFTLTRLLSLGRAALAPRTLCCWSKGFRVRSAYGARLGVNFPPFRMAARPRRSPSALVRGPSRCACAMLHSTSQSKSLFRQGENETFTVVLHFFDCIARWGYHRSIQHSHLRRFASHAGDITAAWSSASFTVLPSHAGDITAAWSSAWSSGKI